MNSGTAERRTDGRVRLRAWGRPLRLCVVLAVVFQVTACTSAGESRMLSIPGTGLVGGVVYLDIDGNGLPGSATDQALRNVRVRLTVAGTRDTVSRASSDANGAFVFGTLPVGRYTVVIPGEAVFGDSISVVRIDTADVYLTPNDTVQVQVAVSYPALTIAEVKDPAQSALGTKVFVQGLVLIDLGVFGDTTIHVSDTSAAIRVTNARGPIVGIGDSVRVLGTIAERDGQRTIDGGQVTILDVNRVASPQRVTAAVAATADGGRLDAALVTVVNATISDTATTVDGDYVVTVDDLSGPLVIVFDADAGLQLVPDAACPTCGPFVPGAVIDATGVLVPSGSGIWWLKPRIDTDAKR